MNREAEAKNCHVSMSSRPDLRSSQPPQVDVSSGIKWPGA
jgi:hypothetical protein